MPKAEVIETNDSCQWLFAMACFSQKMIETAFRLFFVNIISGDKGYFVQIEKRLNITQLITHIS